ncbi:hypothetical protein [Galbitalea soli]|uniref:Uncharacterized protein n=1 Tax=Galbitalea soli TaxID=1268042 RepID=A0A7C9PNQ7_9MICO|nr:hypothetical protein [Galbitalea soli]NEM91589.1 hypothetical protein [Galbitalea soli]NYJ30283.1 hypothetical protein [Galbitalea soli]
MSKSQQPSAATSGVRVAGSTNSVSDGMLGGAFPSRAAGKMSSLLGAPLLQRIGFRRQSRTLRDVS